MFEIIIYAVDGVSKFSTSGNGVDCLAFLKKYDHEGSQLGLWEHGGGPLFQGVDNAARIYATLRKDSRPSTKKPKAPLYAAGFKVAGEVAWFAGPVTNLEDLAHVTPPKDGPDEGVAYIVKLFGDKVTPIARWHNYKWQYKGDKR